MTIRIPVIGTRALTYGTRVPQALPEFVAGGGEPSGDVLHTFPATNWGASSSPTMQHFALAFAPGEVTSSQIPAVRRLGGSEITTVQFEDPARWDDGSIKHIRGFLVDPTDMTASETVDYEAYAKTGSLNKSTTLTLADLQAPNFNVRFYERTEVDNSSESSALPELTASFNDLVATRMYPTRQGPSVLAYHGWIMAKESGGTEHHHVKVYWDVMAIVDPAGGIAGHYLVGAPSLDWWEDPFGTEGKKRQKYKLELRAGTTVLQTYTAAGGGVISNHYSGQMYTVEMADNNNHAKPVWYPGTRAEPTIHLGYDKAAWIRSGFMPRQSEAITLPSYSPQDTYIPLQGMAHDMDVDGTGSHISRHVFSNPDVYDFRLQTPETARYSRANALAIGGFFCHQRSIRTRTIPGQGSADISSAPIVLRMEPRLEADYDYTADGLPIAVDAYGFDGGNPPELKDGYTPILGGITPWSMQTGDNSHLATYGLYSYLMNGYDHLMEPLIDLAIYAINRFVGNGIRPTFIQNSDSGWQTAVGHDIPATQWSAIVALNYGGNHRQMGFGAQALAGVCAAVHEGNFAYNYMRELCAHNANFLDQQLDHYPPNMLDAGRVLYSSNGDWMWAFVTAGLSYASQVMPATGWERGRDISAIYLNHMADVALPRFSSYSPQWVQPDNFAFWSPTNQYYSSATEYGKIADIVSANAAANTITLATISDVQVGDRFRVCPRSITGDTSAAATLGLTAGSDYYVKTSSSNVITVSATEGGATSDITGNPGGLLYSIAVFRDRDNGATYDASVEQDESYFGIHYYGLVMAYNAGATTVDEDVVEKVWTAYQDTEITTWAAWFIEPNS